MIKKSTFCNFFGILKIFIYNCILVFNKFKKVFKGVLKLSLNGIGYLIFFFFGIESNILKLKINFWVLKKIFNLNIIIT